MSARPLPRDLPKEPAPDSFLNVYQAAALRGTSPDTVRRQIKSGELQGVKLSQGRIGVRYSEATKPAT